MRLWNVPLPLLCDKHLRGEHVECHMFVGTLRAGKKVSGFIADGLFEPAILISRHDAIGEEMLRRGGRHESPLHVEPEVVSVLSALPSGCIDVHANINELARRCSDCWDRIQLSGVELTMPRGGDKVFECDGEWWVQITAEQLMDTSYPSKAKALSALEKMRRNMTLKRQGRL